MSRPLAIDVVTIQSQVVYGNVGNMGAMPVFQAGGLQVAQVPSIILSSTPVYPSVHGGPIPLDWFKGWLDDLLRNRALDSLRAVQIGYLGEPAQTGVLKEWLGQVLELRPEVIINIDPVLGDHDTGIYTHPGMVDGWQELMPLATGLTPNAFELGQLSGMPVSTSAEVAAAARSILQGRTQWVLATSAAPDEWEEGTMQSVLVTRSDSQVLKHQFLDSNVRGTGDMFAAGITRELLTGSSLAEAAAASADRVARAVLDSIAADSEEMVTKNVR